MKTFCVRRAYIIALAAVLLFAQGCGKEKDTEPVQVIGFDQLDTEGIASWRPENLDMNSDNDNSTVAEIEGVK